MQVKKAAEAVVHKKTMLQLERFRSTFPKLGLEVSHTRAVPAALAGASVGELWHNDDRQHSPNALREERDATKRCRRLYTHAPLLITGTLVTRGPPPVTRGPPPVTRGTPTRD